MCHYWIVEIGTNTFCFFFRKVNSFIHQWNFFDLIDSSAIFRKFDLFVHTWRSSLSFWSDPIKSIEKVMAALNVFRSVWLWLRLVRRKRTSCHTWGCRLRTRSRPLGPRTASGPDLLLPTAELMTLPASSERGRRRLGSDVVWMCPCSESKKRRKPLLMSHVASS